jgi:membrane associated rhomboid family serine protease
MIPLYDRNPTGTKPIITIALIIACTWVYFFVQPTVGQSRVVGSSSQDKAVAEARFNLDHAAIPRELTTGHPLTDDEVGATLGPPQALCASLQGECYPSKNVYLAILYSMFLHGSLLHLGGNMLFLWVFGNNIEDRWGKGKYLLFYLAAGLVATLAQVAWSPNSTVPMIGASGAIAGVMGAYLVIFPNVPIRTLFFLGIFAFLRDIQAKWLLAFWFLSQFFIGANSGVAYMAHVGGFIFGIVVGLLWRLSGGGDRRALAPAAYPSY